MIIQSHIFGQSVLRASTLCSSQNHFLIYGSTRVTCRNTLLNDSDDQRIISQIVFTVNTCISLGP